MENINSLVTPGRDYKKERIVATKVRFLNRGILKNLIWTAMADNQRIPVLTHALKPRRTPFKIYSAAR
jgi:hypothetical protein